VTQSADPVGAQGVPPEGGGAVVPFPERWSRSGDAGWAASPIPQEGAPEGAPRPIAIVEHDAGRRTVLVIEHREPVVSWHAVDPSIRLGLGPSGALLAVEAVGESRAAARAALFRVLYTEASAITAALERLLA
jgi:hypothetical protein